MGDKIRKWIAVLLAGSILAMIQLAYSGGERCGYRLSDGKHDEDSDLHSRTGTGKSR